jgi:hypothetical protein
VALKSNYTSIRSMKYDRIWHLYERIITGSISNCCARELVRKKYCLISLERSLKYRVNRKYYHNYHIVIQGLAKHYIESTKEDHTSSSVSNIILAFIEDNKQLLLVAEKNSISRILRARSCLNLKKRPYAQ